MTYLRGLPNSHKQWSELYYHKPNTDENWLPKVLRRAGKRAQHLQALRSVRSVPTTTVTPAPGHSTVSPGLYTHTCIHIFLKSLHVWQNINRHWLIQCHYMCSCVLSVIMRTHTAWVKMCACDMAMRSRTTLPVIPIYLWQDSTRQWIRLNPEF